jgi:hypothetical protein
VQPSTLYHLAVLERAADGRRPRPQQPPQRRAVEHKRQRALVRASVLRIPAPRER